MVIFSSNAYIERRSETFLPREQRLPSPKQGPCTRRFQLKLHKSPRVSPGVCLLYSSAHFSRKSAIGDRCSVVKIADLPLDNMHGNSSAGHD